jgi:cholesterol oxidase
MARLSSSVADIKSRYDVVVVGSGYGGAIAACRLAEAKQPKLSVCVLERGREIRPGEYPDTPAKAAGEIQVDMPGHHLFSPTALFDFRLNREMNVLVGCGLGGTSLINANVALRPEPGVFQEKEWPEEIRRAAQSGDLEPYFKRAQEMLGSTDYPPPGFPSLPKQQALERTNAAAGSRRPFKRPLINVTFKEGVNKFGVHQRACQLCGDCVSGCNYGAKNTVLMNYLPEAKRHGAEIFTEVSVRSVKRDGTEWVVLFDLTGSGRRDFGAPPLSVRARGVVLSAGTLGSTEILLRSQTEDLRFSGRLGQRFTGNGDIFALSYNGTEPIDGVGSGYRRPDLHHQVGPCITGMIDLRDGPLEEQMIIEEGSIPGALSPVLPALLGVASVLWGRTAASPEIRTIAQQVTRWSRYLAGAYHGAVRRTQTLLAMAHDDAGGVLRLVDDRLRVEWPSLESEASRAALDRIHKRLALVSRELQATHISNPFRPITVHPLGGCCMGDSAATGVVNHEGRVFDGASGGFHPDLFVCDGSIIPRPLGANPLLTISALAERTCEHILRQAYIETPGPSIAAPPIPTFKPMFYERAKTGIEFAERMTGTFAWVDKAPKWQPSSPVDGTGPWRAALRKPAKTHELTMDLTIVAEDVEALVSHRDHAGRIVGTVYAPELSPEPLQVRDGVFQVFLLEPERVETRMLRYRMRVETVPDAAGRRASYFISGDKIAQNRRRARPWPELSTLYVTVASADGERHGRGVLHLSMRDFLRQLRTMRARHTQGLGERLDVHVRFLGFFVGMLRTLYGRRFARSTISTLDAPPRPRRRIQPKPSVIPVTTSDGTVIHLTRYRGGDRGPVLLSPGFSVRAASFAADTVDENLVERLVREKYDVWLLDYRASSGFAAAGTDFSIDDIAVRDYPAAVKGVRDATGAKDIQIVAHCVGSMALLMSLLAGKLEGAAPLGRLLAARPASDRAEVRGVQGGGVPSLLPAPIPGQADHRPVRPVLAVPPVLEPAAHPVSRPRAVHQPDLPSHPALFGESFRHSKLNTATHDAMHEWFGTTSIPALAHLAMILRIGHVVDRDGVNAYMPHLEPPRSPDLVHPWTGESRIPPPVHARDVRAALREERGGVVQLARDRELRPHGLLHRQAGRRRRLPDHPGGAGGGPAARSTTIGPSMRKYCEAASSCWGMVGTPIGKISRTPSSRM